MKQINIFSISILTLFTLYSAISFGQDQVGYTTFKVEKGIEGVELKWRTGQQIPVNYFEVQKSQDGKNFKTIGIVLAPEQEIGAKFEMNDKQLIIKRKVFYRLKHVALDG